MVVLALAAGMAAGAERAPAPSLATWRTGSEPLQVDARTMDIRGTDGLVVFEGEVVARQGEVTLHADRVEVRADQKTRELRSVRARGNVRLRKAEVVATGEQADYDAVAGVAVLTGSPKVWRDRDVVAGDKITLYLAEDRSVVEGAKAVIFPPAKQEGGEAR